jgi:hypothetical protein
MTVVARVVAVFVAIGLVAWAFVMNAPSPKKAACAPLPAEALAVVPDRVAVNVFNSTAETGLGERIAKDLESRGFTIGEVGNDPLRRKIRGTGELRSGPAGQRQVAALQRWQPRRSVILDKRRRGPTVDFVLGTKFAKRNDVPAPPAGVTGCAPESASQP